MSHIYVHETAPCPACALTQAHPTSLHSSHIYISIIFTMLENRIQKAFLTFLVSATAPQLHLL